MYRKHKNTRKTYKHTHTSTNILKCMHTHTHAAQFMYIKFPLLLLDVSCSMKTHVLKVWVSDGLLKSGWIIRLSIIRGLAHWWWNGLLDLAGRTGPYCVLLGHILPLFFLCVSLSLSFHSRLSSVEPLCFPACYVRHFALPDEFPTVQPSDLELTPVKQWAQINPAFLYGSFEIF